MPSPQSHLSLHNFERALLLSDFATLSSHNHPIAASLSQGNYTPLLSSPTPTSPLPLRLIHDLLSNPSSPSLFLSTLHSALTPSVSDLLAVYTAGVTLLQAFLSANFAGPWPLDNPFSHEEESAAALVLASGGEDVARPARYLVWLRAARHVLVDGVEDLVRCGAKLAPWWAARVLLAHQAVLSGPAPELSFGVFTMFARVLGKDIVATRDLYGDVGGNKKVVKLEDEGEDEDVFFFLVSPEGREEDEDFVNVLDERNGGDTRLKVLLLLEVALAQRFYYDSDGAAKSLQRACWIEKVAFGVAGEMGVRTKFQTKPTAQLVARAFNVVHDEVDSGDVVVEDFKVSFPRAGGRPGTDVVTEERVEFALPPLPIDVPVNDTDVLGFISLTGDKESVVTASENGEDLELEEEEVLVLGEEKEHLTPIQQALALGKAAVVRARNAAHLLTREEMAPYVNLVLQNANSPFGTSSMVQLRALLWRVSFEQDRGRYLERCMAQMEEIGKFIDDPLDSVSEVTRNAAACERNLFLFACSVPPRWELKKELAIAFGKIGLVKSAMEIFEKLEYWDELVDCHRLIGNLGAAEALIVEQLELLDSAVLEEGIIDNSEQPAGVLNLGSQSAVHARAARRPRLLCVLGDVTRNKEHFEIAWKESDGRYARAKRALARMCVESEDWEEAVEHFKEALAINHLFPDVWFTYGCAALQMNNMKLAAHAFTTVVQQTPENGEAWNNLGRVLHELGKEKAALKALSQAGKIMRDSWRIWNNVLMIATEMPSSLDIVRSMERLLELRGKDGVMSESLGVAVSEVIRMSDSEDVEDKALVGSVCRRLLKILGRCTTLVSTNPSIWAAYAQLHELVAGSGGAQKAFDCRLKQVRSLIAQGDWKSDRREFCHMVLASDSLAKDAIQSQNSLSIRAAKIHLRSVIEQTRDDFKDDEGFSRLKLTEEVLKANQG